MNKILIMPFKMTYDRGKHLKENFYIKLNKISLRQREKVNKNP